MSCGNDLTLDATDLRDRVDVLARRAGVVSKEVVGTAEQVEARGIPCAIGTQRASTLATIFGQVAQGTVIAIFGNHKRIEPNFRLRTTDQDGDAFTYVVKTVDRYPAPHHWSIQRATLEVDVTEQRA